MLSDIVVVDLSSSKLHFKGLNWIANLDYGWKGMYIYLIFWNVYKTGFKIVGVVKRT